MYMYRVPKEEELRKAIYYALKKHGTFSSLTNLRDNVITELKKIEKEYTVFFNSEYRYLFRENIET